MKGKKVMIWVGDTPHEVMVRSRETLIEAIGNALKDHSRSSELGEVVPEDDRNWGGYRRITVHVSPPICHTRECYETLREHEATVCTSCMGEE